MDILFATMYLSWSTKQPRVHQMKMGKAVLSYLHHTRGEMDAANNCELIGYSDASLGTGPKRGSIKAHMFKLGSKSGAITSKCNTTASVYTSSFEAELDGVTSGMKTALRLMKILDEVSNASYGNVAKLFNDNKAMINFVRGEGMAKGIRHVQLRMFYTRECYDEGKILSDYMSGEVIPVDQLTKIGTKESFQNFRQDILGLTLWEGDTSVLYEDFSSAECEDNTVHFSPHNQEE